MKIHALFLIPFFMLPTSGFATPLSEPELNKCNTSKGITKCEVKCVRSLGEQCLITHINFEGQNLRGESSLLKAKFQTCKNANIDLQLKSISMGLNETETNLGDGILSSTASSNLGSVHTKAIKSIMFNEPETEGYKARIPFSDFLNSGDNFIIASVNLIQCGSKNALNACHISGKLVTVTDPNIRCDFHDTTQSGAFRPPSLQISPSLQNSQQPIGQIGQ